MEKRIETRSLQHLDMKKRRITLLQLNEQKEDGTRSLLPVDTEKRGITLLQFNEQK
jgi:hypothetical protein